MNEDNIREKTDFELEREELNLLVKQGIKFSVTHKVHRRKKGVKGLFQRPEIVTVKEDFEIQEPTLSVLDRLSAIWVEMEVNEDRLTAGGTETLAEAKRIAKERRTYGPNNRYCRIGRRLPRYRSWCWRTD